MVEKNCQHYLFNFIYLFSFFPIFLSFLFRSTFLCKKNHRETPGSTATAANPCTPTVPTFFTDCRNSFMASAPTSCTATAAPPSPLLPQHLHRRCRNSLHRHASFFASSHRNSLHDHRYNFVYHFFHSAQLSSAISTVASYTTNFIKFIANRRSVLSF